MYCLPNYTRHMSEDTNLHEIRGVLGGENLIVVFGLSGYDRFSLVDGYWRFGGTFSHNLMLFPEYLHSIYLRNLRNHIPKLHGAVTTKTTLQNQHCLVHTYYVHCPICNIVIIHVGVSVALPHSLKTWKEVCVPDYFQEVLSIINVPCNSL